MKIQLSDHFPHGKLIRFTLPSVFMMIFIFIYGMADGYFVSNIVGKTAFAAVNLIIPFLQIIGGVGAMLGVGGLLPFFRFLSKRNTSALRFWKTKFEPRPMLLACANGYSEMMTSVSASVTGVLYNMQLMRYAGEDGVAAYGVVMYAAFVFIGIYMGYSSGCSPIMGYHFGAAHHGEMKNVFRQCLILLGAASVVLTLTAVLSAGVISSFFVGYDAALHAMTKRAFVICALPFFVMWFNMYASSLFTALNNGAISAAISFLRSLVLPALCILTLPLVFKLDGVWYALAGSEMLSVFVSLFFVLSQKKKYGY